MRQVCVTIATAALSVVLGGDLAAAQSRTPDGFPQPGAVNPVPPGQLQLSPTQKTAILSAVRQRGAAVRPPASTFAVAVGEMVPPSIELYILPDQALAEVPEAKSIKYTVIHNQVVLVDPTNMRIVDVLK